MTDPPRIPAIVGVGEINDRPTANELGLDSVELMLAAARSADADADAGGGWLDRCDWVESIPQISFREYDVPAMLSQALDIPASCIHPALSPDGDSPVRQINDAANAFGAGEASVCLLLGGEAVQHLAAPGCRSREQPAAVRRIDRHRHRPAPPLWHGHPVRDLSAIRKRYPCGLGTDACRRTVRDRRNLVAPVTSCRTERWSLDQAAPHPCRNRRDCRRQPPDRLSLHQIHRGQQLGKSRRSADRHQPGPGAGGRG